MCIETNWISYPWIWSVLSQCSVSTQTWVSKIAGGLDIKQHGCLQSTTQLSHIHSTPHTISHHKHKRTLARRDVCNLKDMWVGSLSRGETCTGSHPAATLPTVSLWKIIGQLLKSKNWDHSRLQWGKIVLCLFQEAFSVTELKMHVCIMTLSGFLWDTHSTEVQRFCQQTEGKLCYYNTLLSNYYLGWCHYLFTAE